MASLANGYRTCARDGFRKGSTHPTSYFYYELVRGQTNQALATHFIASDLETPAITKTHLLVSWATSIGLVWLAQKAPCACGFGTFSLVMHDGYLHPLDEIIDHFFSPGFSLLAFERFATPVVTHLARCRTKYSISTLLLMPDSKP